jgi:hypothetical protein
MSPAAVYITKQILIRMLQSDSFKQLSSPSKLQLTPAEEVLKTAYDQSKDSFSDRAAR